MKEYRIAGETQRSYFVLQPSLERAVTEMLGRNAATGAGRLPQAPFVVEERHSDDPKAWTVVSKSRIDEAIAKIEAEDRARLQSISKGR